MARLQPAEVALSALAQYSRQQFVCRTCRARLIRQLHSSSRVRAEQPLLQRLKTSIFGTKEGREKEKRREEARKKGIAKAAEEDVTKMKMRDVNGVTYQVAPVVDQQATHPGYVPATTWENLEHIGSEEYVKKVQDRGEVYRGFISPQREKLSDEQVAQLIHHTVVEVLVLQKAGRDVNEVCHYRSAEHQDWRHTQNASITLGDSGNAWLHFNSDAAESLILDAIPKDARSTENENNASTVGLSDSEIGDNTIANLSQHPTDGTPWMDMKLQDANLKLVIIKRLLQLIGARPSDYLLSSATTLEGLYNAFKIKEKPKKLAESEEMLSMNDEISNITFHPRKRSMIDKEKAVGRWKVIEEELMKRDLPVTGNRWPDAKPVVTAEWVRQ